MLVLSRKVGEQIILENSGQEIGIRVLEIDGKRVRLGIEALPEVGIYRREIYERMSSFYLVVPPVEASFSGNAQDLPSGSA